MKVKIKKKNNSFLFATFLWIYIITNTTLYIKNYAPHYLIEGMSLLGMFFVFFFSGKLFYKWKLHKIIILYVLGVLCFLIPDILSGNKTGLSMGINLFLPIIILFFLISVMEKQTELKYLIHIPIVYGFIISLQSLILGALIYFGVNVGGHYETIEKNGGASRFVYDYFLGLQSTIFNLGKHKLPRLNSYYLEPAKFAFFLIIPFVITLFKYKETKKKPYLFVSLICVACLFLTFSRAGYVSCIIAFGIFAILKKFVQENKKATFNDLVLILIGLILLVGIVFGIFIVINYLIENGNSNNWLLKQFTFSENGKVVLVRSESSNFSGIIQRLSDRPIGYGMTVLLHNGGQYDYNVANALSFWLYGSGYIGTLIIVTIIIKLTVTYAIPCIKSKNYLKNAFGVIYLAQTIFSFSYGTWMNIDYIFTIGIMIVLCTKENIKYENIDCC